MVPDPSTLETSNTATNDGSDTLVNAVFGAVAGIVLSFIPLSAVFGVRSLATSRAVTQVMGCAWEQSRVSSCSSCTSSSG